jgi:putative hydrolase of the HAD superfamily
MKTDMIIKKPIKGIFFDIGWTMAYPATGNFMLPKSFFNRVDNEVFNELPKERKDRTFEKVMRYLEHNHLVLSVDEEFEQFINFYKILSEEWPELNITQRDIRDFTHEMVYAPDTILIFDGVIETLEKLKGKYKLGIISDTWPSTERFLKAWNICGYFDAITFSCYLGTFKPDKRMYLDALEKIGLSANETVFIDDSEENLDGAAKCGIQPVLITIKPNAKNSGKYPAVNSVSEIFKYL